MPAPTKTPTRTKPKTEPAPERERRMVPDKICPNQGDKIVRRGVPYLP